MLILDRTCYLTFENVCIFSLLFYSAEGNPSSVIERCDMSGRNCWTLMNSNDQNRMTGLVVDPEELHLYWISESDDEVFIIYSSTLEGEYLMKIYER